MRHVWPDKRQSFLGASTSEIGTFRQEALTRVNGVASRLFGRSNDCVNVQVSGRSGARQCARLVSCAKMKTAAIIGGENSYGRQAHVGCCPSNTDGDFASVGD
jgi:hypothetical protein